MNIKIQTHFNEHIMFVSWGSLVFSSAWDLYQALGKENVLHCQRK